MSENIATNF